MHKRTRKKRTAIPVQPPRVPGGFTLPVVHSAPTTEIDTDKANGTCITKNLGIVLL